MADTLHDYGSTQFNLSPALAAQVAKLTGTIKAADLAEDGRETNPHITVQYGLPALSTKDLAAITRAVERHPPVAITLGKTSIFPASETGADYDVVKLDVTGAGLLSLRKAIRSCVSVTDTHPTYQPHITLAYVKTDKGAQYAGNASLAGTTDVLATLTLSDQDEHTTALPLKGKEAYMASDGKGGYLVTESDGTQHLPTKKNGVLDRGLCGAAWASLHGGFRGQKYDGPNKDDAISKLTAIYKAQGWPLPNSDAGMSAPTALGSDKPPDGMVYRSGLIFKAGDYPDQRMNVTAADLEAAVVAFKGPLDAELEHFNTEGHKTFLDGHLGQLVEVWAKGGDLFGKLLVPEWMDPMWEAFGRKVSIVLNRATKQLTRIGLVLDPQVEEAAVMSAYSAFAGNRHSAADRKDIQQIHELAGNLGAECSPTTTSMSAKTDGRKFMQLDSIAFWKRGGRRFREEARQEGINTVPDEEVFTLLDDHERQEAERIAKDLETKFEARIASAEAKEKAAEEALFKATAQRLQGEAAAFADGLIVGNKLLPAEREGLIAALTTAGMDDAASGPVTFSNGTQGSRVEQLKAMYSARPAHGLTQEQLAGNAPFSVVQGGQPAPKTGPDAYDEEKLLGMTALGQAALRRRAKQA